MDTSVIFSRTEKLIGEENLKKLKNAHVAVFGLGGVGSFTAEALVRAGIGAVTIVDNDVVSQSNINRQSIAFLSTVGKKKTEVMENRIKDISPDCKVRALPIFFDESTRSELDFSEFTYVADCIDSVQSKILIIKLATEAGTGIISCMGTGNKLDPSRLTVDDIKNTSYCPLARAVRTRLKKEGIYSLEVVYSKEPPITTEGVPASISFVPSVAGLLMAGRIINKIISE